MINAFHLRPTDISRRAASVYIECFPMSATLIVIGDDLAILESDLENALEVIRSVRRGIIEDTHPTDLLLADYAAGLEEGHAI